MAFFLPVYKPFTDLLCEFEGISNYIGQQLDDAPLVRDNGWDGFGDSELKHNPGLGHGA